MKSQKSKNNKNKHVKIYQKWDGYFLEDMDCSLCQHWRGKKQGCSRLSCCCEKEKSDAIANERIKRKKGIKQWDSWSVHKTALKS